MSLNLSSEPVLNVLLPVIVCVPEVLKTVVSTATASAATDIPSPAPTLSVISELNAPPSVNPVPAVTVLVVLTTVESTATASAVTDMPPPTPPTTLSVTFHQLMFHHQLNHHRQLHL